MSAAPAPSGRPRHLTLIAGARPNFMKIAPLVRALEAHNAAADAAIGWTLVHTGQHYDHAMSESFFEDLGIPAPHHNLGVGSGSHAEQTAGVMVALERLLLAEPTGLVVVVGDVNSTMAASIVARKLQVAVAHVEAGLRSGDAAMPEEINRLVTDRLSELFFTTDPAAERHLAAEGVPAERIHRVGNVMVDTLLANREKARAVDRFDHFKRTGRLDADAPPGAGEVRPYGLLTLHRPSNVDDEPTFRRLAGVLREIAAELPLLFARHPRTAARMERFGIDLGPQVALTGPLAYHETLNLMQDAAVVLTDSGGLQEETTALGVPCLTLRENTERPVTVEEGTNQLVGTDPARIRAAFRAVREGRGKAGRVPELWDGRAAERIVAVLARWFETA